MVKFLPLSFVISVESISIQYFLVTDRRKENVMSVISSFLNDESGAIPMDWIVIAASIAGISIAVFVTVFGAV